MRIWWRWAGESSHCEDPATTVGIAGKALRRMALSDIYSTAGIKQERRSGGKRRGTLRRYVLREMGE